MRDAEEQMRHLMCAGNREKFVRFFGLVLGAVRISRFRLYEAGRQKQERKGFFFPSCTNLDYLDLR